MLIGLSDVDLLVATFIVCLKSIGLLLRL